MMDRERRLFGIGAQAQLERDQEAAEAAREYREKQDAKRVAELKERDEKRAEQVKRWQEEDAKVAAERAAAREAERLERTKVAAAELKARLREQYLRTPGSTPQQFEKVWPRLLEEHQIRETLAASDPIATLKAEMRAARGPALLHEARPIPVAVESD